MANSLSHRLILLPIIAAILRNARLAAVALLVLALLGVPPRAVFGQSTAQQEQQQREQQERDRQQREQQEREQQQREQQQREQQAREQQQREQQEREQQARDQQQREQEQRDQQKRIEQQQHSSSDVTAPSANAAAEVSRPTVQPATNVKHATSDSQPVGVERRINSAPANAKAAEDRPSGAVAPAAERVESKPVADLSKPCTDKDEDCQPCPAGQAKSKDGSCTPTPSAKIVAPRTPAKTGVQPTCPAGEISNGAQCQIIGARQCPAGQTMVDATCQANCTIATAGAQNIIVQLRSARQDKDTACAKDPAGQQCREADTDYDMWLLEYRSFLGSVPIECQTTLPDPIAI